MSDAVSCVALAEWECSLAYAANWLALTERGFSLASAVNCVALTVPFVPRDADRLLGHENCCRAWAVGAHEPKFVTVSDVSGDARSRR